MPAPEFVVLAPIVSDWLVVGDSCNVAPAATVNELNVPLSVPKFNVPALTVTDPEIANGAPIMKVFPVEFIVNDPVLVIVNVPAEVPS